MKQISQKILLLSVIVTALFSCTNNEKKAPVPIRPVKYQTIELQGASSSRTFSGSAQTEKIINLSFRSSGIITELNMKIGQRVRKGQLLAKLDNVQARLSYEKARTQVNSAESQMNTAKLGLNRVRSLYEKGSASLSDFENAKNGFKTAQEGYEAAKRGLAIQGEQIKFGYIYAPENGVIASVNTEVDENAGPGQVVATLNAGTAMEIDLGIPESVINSVKKGMDVSIQFTALKDEIFKGKVNEVSPAVNSNTATYPVKIKITNPTDLIKSGMAANVTFNCKKGKANGKKLIVPTNAVGEDSKGNFVFVLQGNGDVVTAKKQQVTIGKLTEEGFEIMKGLSAGNKIATAGLQTLLDGQKVRLSKN